MAAEFIPTVMAHGFHASPVFGIFGAAIAAAEAKQIHGAIAQCVNLAAGNTRRRAQRRPLVARGRRRQERASRGRARQAHRHAGAGTKSRPLSARLCRRAALQLHRRQPRDLAKITQGLGRDWILLETLYRVYSTASYDITIDVTGMAHAITYDQIDRIEAVVNWLEISISKPWFPSRGIETRPGSGGTPYFTAYGAVARGYPLLRGGQPGPAKATPRKCST